MTDSERDAHRAHTVPGCRWCEVMSDAARDAARQPADVGREAWLSGDVDPDRVIEPDPE